MGASFIHDAKVQEIKIPMAHNCSERLITLWNGRTPDSKGRRTGYPKVIRTPDSCIIRTPDCNVALLGLPHMRVLGLTKSKDPTLCNLIVSHMTYDSYTLYKIIYI